MEKEYKDIKFILKKENIYLSYPLIKENYEYIKKLKAKGYQLYLLTNITEDSYQYIYEKINISEFFAEGIYSFQEHLIKPDKKIYELLMNRFGLKKEETVFFDDRKSNVLEANKCRIKSFLFHSIDDLKRVIEMETKRK